MFTTTTTGSRIVPSDGDNVRLFDPWYFQSIVSRLTYAHAVQQKRISELLREFYVLFVKGMRLILCSVRLTEGSTTEPMRTRIMQIKNRFLATASCLLDHL